MVETAETVAIVATPPEVPTTQALAHQVAQVLAAISDVVDREDAVALVDRVVAALVAPVARASEYSRSTPTWT